MSKTITIQGTPIDFPTSGSPSSWAGPVVQFAESVETALDAAVGPYDVPGQTYNIDAYNTGTAIIPNLEFDNAEVRSAVITISCIRANSSSAALTVSEITEFSMVYNPDAASTEKWQWSRERTGNANITYSVSDAGQVSFTTTTIGGAGSHSGTLSFSAKALTQV